MKRTIFITSLILFTLSSCTKDKELLEAIYNEPGYAIGTVNSSVSGSFGVKYNYSYYVGSSEYKGNRKAVGINQEGNFIVGYRFLVVYKLSEPAKSDIKFNYRINTEQDFLDLLEKFKDNPPKP